MTDLSKHNPTGRFSGLAEIYARCRPSYPAEAVEFVLTQCHLTKDSIMVDVGAGTGISSRLFASAGLTVIGVEPNDDMRQQAETQSKAESGKIIFKKGTAEQTGCDNECANVVLCAQAFHWFEPVSALREFKRILKPHGWVVLIWNERDEEDPFTREYGTLLRGLRDTSCVEVPRGAAGKPFFLDSNLFHDQQLRTFSNSQELDEEGLIGRAFSASYAPKEQSEADAFSQSLRGLFKRFQHDGQVSLIYETSVYYGHK